MLAPISLNVIARCRYPSWDWKHIPFREEDHRAHFFVHAVKNDKAKIGARTMRFVKVNGEPVTVSAHNLHFLQNAFARWVARFVEHQRIDKPIFVALPNRSGFGQNSEFPTHFLAKRAAKYHGIEARAFGGLRFRHFLEKCHERRLTFSELKDAFCLVEDLPQGNLVLIDDVFTQGRHVSAAVRCLGRCPELVLVAARTVNEPTDSMFSVNSERHIIFTP